MNHNNPLDIPRRLPSFSLEQLALIKVTTMLCNNPRLLKLIIKSYLKYPINRFLIRIDDEGMAIRAMAEKLISQVWISAALKERVLEYVNHISYRIIWWKSTYAPSIGIKFLQKFYWTDRGRVDSVRTMQHIVANKEISVRRRFTLSCSVCLSKEIQEIWDEMSIDDKLYFYRKNLLQMCPLVFYWAHSMVGSEYVFEECMTDALVCALQFGLLEAVKYLFSTLITPGERRYRAMFCLREFRIQMHDQYFLEEDEIDMGYFLLSQSAAANTEILSSNYPMTTLSILLHSTESELFLKLLAERLEFDSTFEVHTLLMKIFRYYHLQIINFSNYGMLFVNVWRMLPNDFRRDSDSPLGVTILLTLINDNFPFLLEEGWSEKITKLFSLNSNNGTSTTTIKLHRGKWEFLKFVIIEEVITIATLKGRRFVVNTLCNKMKTNEAAWNRLLRFVQKIKDEYPKQEG